MIARYTAGAAGISRSTTISWVISTVAWPKSVRRTGVDKVNLLGVCEGGVFDIIEVGGTYGWVASGNIHNL